DDRPGAPLDRKAGLREDARSQGLSRRTEGEVRSGARQGGSMAQDPAPRPEQETSVDVFEHEMADLEQSVWKENRIHPLIVVAGAAVIALCLGGGFLFLSSTQRRDPSSPTTMTIEVREPRPGRLSARPTRFSWESTAGTRGYMLTIREQGSQTDLIIRESPS